MSFDIDKEFRAIAQGLQERLPLLQSGTPSMYSKDGQYLYVKTADLAVGKDSHDFPMVESLFRSTEEAKVEGIHFSHPSFKYKKEYETALDHELLAAWIKRYFWKEADKELQTAVKALLG